MRFEKDHTSVQTVHQLFTLQIWPGHYVGVCFSTAHVLHGTSWSSGRPVGDNERIWSHEAFGSFLPELIHSPQVLDCPKGCCSSLILVLMLLTLRRALTGIACLLFCRRKRFSRLCPSVSFSMHWGNKIWANTRTTSLSSCKYKQSKWVSTSSRSLEPPSSSVTWKNPAEPNPSEGLYIQSGLGTHSGIPEEELKMLLGRGISGIPCLVGCCYMTQIQICKKKTSDGLMDLHFLKEVEFYYFSQGRTFSWNLNMPPL